MLAELQNQGKVAASSVLSAWSKTISSVDDQRSCSVCLDEDERASEQSSTPQFPHYLSQIQHVGQKNIHITLQVKK
jgi:hypothetical protein